MSHAAKPKLLSVFGLFPQDLQKFEQHFDVIFRPNATLDEIREFGAEAEGVLTIGSIGLSAEAMAVMPKLRIVLNLGAGYEAVDVEAAKARGVHVTTGYGLNREAVADHAMALVLSAVREIPRSDRMVREGEWTKARSRLKALSEMSIGILGLGDIGLAIARRATAFGTTVRYNNRRERQDVDYAFVPSLVDLAAQSDILIVACPGGPATHHAVDAKVLEALGPDGYLVNISRGSVVDTQALIPVLRDGGIKMAALDVFETEPHVPEELRALQNVILTPHVAGTSIAAVNATVDRAINNFLSCIKGEPLVGAL
jgi:lactate dehydrogenase-like 2-hydroxyacid dehydrogenase